MEMVRLAEEGTELQWGAVTTITNSQEIWDTIEERDTEELQMKLKGGMSALAASPMERKEA